MGKIAKIIEDGLSQIFYDELSEIGRDVTTLDSNDKIFIAYFSHCLLFPRPDKYKVHIHRDFVCPPEYTEGYEILRKKIQEGERFSAHLSRTTKDTEKHDLMLYDWGIYHFHLGQIIEKDGYITRTSKLLYAYINCCDVYFLGIFEHGKWNDQDLIELIHRYYPWSIKGWRIEGTPEKIITADEHKELRNAHINAIVTLADGTSYMGPGWGITAAGTSARVSLQATDKRREIRCFEEKIISDIPNAQSCSWIVKREGNNIVLSNNMKDNIILYSWMPLRNRIEQQY